MKMTNKSIINQKSIELNMQIIVNKIKRSELINYMRKKTRNIDLDKVRERTSKINNNLSEDVIKSREERV